MIYTKLTRVLCILWYLFINYIYFLIALDYDSLFHNIIFFLGEKLPLKLFLIRYSMFWCTVQITKILRIFVKLAVSFHLTNLWNHFRNCYPVYPWCEHNFFEGKSKGKAFFQGSFNKFKVTLKAFSAFAQYFCWHALLGKWSSLSRVSLVNMSQFLKFTAFFSFEWKKT